MNAIERHVVLIAPEVHWNTGNIGRTCLGADATLHLIKPLGFSLEDRYLKRAGLDYWHDIQLKVWQNFKDFCDRMQPLTEEIILVTKNGQKPFWEIPHATRLFLIFGSETKGIPESIFLQYQASSYHIPTSKNIRCLNLSTAAGIVLYESLRHHSPPHAWHK